MSQYTPTQKLKKIEKLNQVYEINKIITQLNKSALFEEKKNKRKIKLSLKLNKFEIRTNKGVFFI